MTLSDILALSASGVVMVVYATYLYQVVKGASTPNPATWIIWVTVSLLNAISFVQIADTWYQGLISVTMTVFVSVIFIYSLLKRKFTPLKRLEKGILVLTGIFGLIWLITGNERLANVLMQISLLASFWPTIQGLHLGTAKEKPLPWIIAVLAYLLIIISMILSYNGNWLAFVYPLLNGVIGNGIIAALALCKRQ